MKTYPTTQTLLIAGALLNVLVLVLKILNWITQIGFLWGAIPGSLLIVVGLILTCLRKQKQKKA